MKFIDYSIKNTVVVRFLVFLLIIGGIFSYNKLGKLEDPEFKIKEALVITLYPEADAHTVELQVTDKIEEENKVPINTRDILEKGLTFVGSSRSGRVDFENAIKFMEDKSIQRRLKSIIYESDEVKNISDIHKAFSVDIDTDFKTVFKWSV